MGNSFNIVKELDQISRLIQESKVNEKRVEALSQTLGEFSLKLKQSGLDGVQQFNHYGAAKNWKTISTLLKHEDKDVLFHTLKILFELLQSKESVEPFLQNKILQELMTILHKRDLASKNVTSHILSLISDDSRVVAEMRDQQIEIILADFLHQHKLRLKPTDKDFLTELESKKLCIQAVANILARPDEEKNKFNFVRSRGLEALCILSDSADTRDCIRPTMTCLANMATNAKLQEEMDFNGSVEDLAKNMNEFDGEIALFQCGRFLFLVIESESFLTKLIKNKTFPEIAELTKKVREKRYTYLMFLLVFLRLNTTANGAEVISKIKGLRESIGNIKSTKIIDQDLDNPNFALLMDCILKMTNQIRLPGVNLSALPNMVYIVANVLELICLRISGKRAKKPTEKEQENEKILLTTLFKVVINLSLSHECQTMLLKANALDYMYKLCQYEVSQCKDEVASESLLFCLRATTNLFMQLPVKTLEKDHKFTEIFLELQSWGTSSEYPDSDSSKYMREELKLILTVLPSIETASNANDLARFFIKCLYSSNDFTVYKALGCLNIVIIRESFKTIVFEHKIHKVLINMMLRQEPFLARQAVSCLKNLLKGPSDMLLWMKFGSDKLEIDSSAQNFVLKYGHSKRSSALNINSFYLDWGVRTNRDDLFFIPDFPEMDEYSISVWYLLPSKANKIAIFHTLLQGDDGVGGIVMDPDLENIGIFDEVTGDFKVLLDLKILKNRQAWQNLILLVKKNENSSPSHSIDVFHNGNPISQGIEVNAPTKFTYVGNSKMRDEAFGVFGDLRVYNKIISQDERQAISTRADFPDQAPQKLEEGFCCAKVVEKLKVNDPELQMELCGLARAISTNPQTKLALLKNGVFDALVPILLRSTNEDLKVEAGRAMSYLA